MKHGLMVFGGIIQVHMDKSGNPYVIQNSLITNVSIPLTPSVIRETARERVRLYTADRLGISVDSLEVQSINLGLLSGDTQVRLVYRAALRHGDTLRRYRTDVDAHSGRVFNFHPLYRRLTAKGKVWKDSRAENLKVVNNALQASYESTLRDNNDTTAGFSSELYGTVKLRGADTDLKGPHVDIRDIEAPSVPVPRSKDGDFRVERHSDTFEAVMAYYHVDRNRRYLDSLGYSKAYDTPIRVDPQGASGDNNAYFNFGAEVPYLVFGTGGVDLAEDADIILHEHAHAIQHFLSDGHFHFNSKASAMAEGFADYWAAINTPTPTGDITGLEELDPACVGEWGISPPECLRRTDSTNKYPGDYIGSGVSQHSDGMIWSGALWDLRTSSFTDTNDLNKTILESFFLVPESPSFDEAAVALLEATSMRYSDETNFNEDVRYNGTVFGDNQQGRVQTICNAFQKHGMLSTCANVETVDDAENDGSLPELTGELITHEDREYWIVTTGDLNYDTMIATLCPRTDDCSTTTDFDLYMKRNDFPTPFNYHRRAFETSYPDSVAIGNIQSNAQYFFLVNPYSGGDTPADNQGEYRMSITFQGPLTSGGGSEDGGGGSGCLIETMGSPVEANEFIRVLRDHLLTTRWGRYFTKKYYGIQ
jgi:hypothetical protein